MDTRNGLAGGVLFGKTRGAVLGVLFGEPEGWYHLRDLARRAGAGAGPAQREMVMLAEAGLVERVRRGKQVFYRVNRGSGVYHELRGLVVKTVGREGFRVRGSGFRREAAERPEVDVTLL